MGEAILNETKTDAIGEIHNITMGSAAIAISNMIEATVSITTPQVTVCKASDIVLGKLKEPINDYLFEEGKESVFVKIDYIKGIKGTSLLVLNPDDVQIIVNKLMGLPAELTDDFEFDEMRISAICEVMNQMMGASATSMSQMLNVPIDISPPETIVSDDNNKLFELQNVKPSQTVCAVSFDITIDDVVKSKFINLLSIELADSMVEKLFQVNMGTNSTGASLDDESDSDVLSDEKRDAIGELQNMMMGSAATALSNFMNAKVWITTPKVRVDKAGNIKFDELDPSICVKIKYVKGMHGSSVLVLKQSDVQLMVNQLMGMPPVVTDDFVFDEMNISAVCEIMNQMMGASATTLSEILNTPTDISTPEAIVIDSIDDILKINNIDEDQTVCAISFDLTIDDLINSHFVTMLTIDLANEMGDKMLGSYMPDEVPVAPQKQTSSKTEPAPKKEKPAEKKRRPASSKPAPAEKKVINNNSSTAKNMRVEEFNMSSFYDDDDDDNFISKEQFKNLKPLLDVPMEVSVRIGTTQRRIEEVSDFTKGTIIELDKMANEPVEILVNGNLMARGEVVVVDDNFAVRITEIVK